MEETASPHIQGTRTPKRRQSPLTVSLKDQRLAKKVELVFGFMSFIPLLLIVMAFFTFVFPRVHDPSIQEILRWLLVGTIASIFVGYVVLKRTVGSVMGLVQQARTITQQQLGDPVDGVGGGDEIVELARTFNRVTHELEGKIQELESSRALIKRLLARIGSAIVSYQGIDSLLGLIMENATVALGAQMGSLLLVDEPAQELEPKATWSVGGQPVTATRMKLGQGIVGQVAKDKRPMRTAGSAAELGLSRPEGREDHAASVLCVPLNLQERTLGVIAVLRDGVVKPFTEDDEVVLANIGSQVAVAIENYRLNLDIERTYLETVMALALAVEAKDSYSAGHSKRVSFYSTTIAEAMHADEETKKILKDAGLLHDVGKIGIKDEVLQKAERLTPEELELMRQHPVIGEAILKPLRSLGRVAEVVRHHHEAYDGSGYPSGLKGARIPFAVRILTVADTYDAMVTDRPYRKRLTLQHAMQELRDGAGTQFDPTVVEVFLKLLEEKAERLIEHNRTD